MNKMQSLGLVPQLVLLFLCCSTLLSCSGMRPSGAKRGGKLFETFYVGAEGTQYFIKPLKFEGSNNEELEADITFRYKDKLKGAAEIKITFLTNDIFQVADSLLITNAREAKAKVESLDFMYTEREKDVFACRFTAVVDLPNLAALFSDNNWQLNLHRGDSTFQYQPTKKTKKRIDVLKYSVFELLR